MSQHLAPCSNAIDDLRQLIGRASAMAHVTSELFDRVIHVDDLDDRQHLERLSYLADATYDAIEAALAKCTELGTTMLYGEKP